jgi:uncharacterized protein
VPRGAPSIAHQDAPALESERGGGRFTYRPGPAARARCTSRRDSKNAAGDPADPPSTPHGHWVWNELHTTDVAKALLFHERVVGFSHRAMDMGSGGVYHVLSKGGVERGGVTHWLAPGAPAHWLPYVAVDDADATLARAKERGATILFGPEEIPGVGRLGGWADPTGAALAIIKPMPRKSHR